MRFSSFLTCSVSLVLLISIWSCQDHRIPTNPSATRLRVKTLAQDYPNNARKITYFSYDSQGRINQFNTYVSPDSLNNPIEINTYQYDTQNRLVRHQRTISSPPNYVYGPSADRYQYSYNATGKVSTIQHTYYNPISPAHGTVDPAALDDPNLPQDVVQLQYNQAGQLVGSNLTTYSQGVVNPGFSQVRQCVHER